MASERTLPFPDARPASIAGGAVAAACLLSVFAIAHHPQAGGHTRDLVLAKMVALTTVDEVVHGVLIAFTTMLLFGLTVFSIRRGIGREAVAGGLVAYALGAVAVIGAAAIDGFLLPAVATTTLAMPPGARDAGFSTLALLSDAVQLATRGSFIATALAIVAWSTDLFRDGGSARLCAIVGFIAAPVTLVLLGLTHELAPVNLLAILGAQGVWYLGVAALLLRGRV